MHHFNLLPFGIFLGTFFKALLNILHLWSGTLSLSMPSFLNTFRSITPSTLIISATCSEQPSTCLTHSNYLLSRQSGSRAGALHLRKINRLRIILPLTHFIQQDDEMQSAWNCDGEVLKNGKIFVKSHRQLVPVFAR